MSAPLVLALFCGICLASFFGPADGVLDIPENMNREIQKLMKHFNVKADKTLIGSPIFLQNIYGHEKFEENEQRLPLQENEQRLLLQESLDVYNRILSDMLKQTQDVEIRTSITIIKDRMEELRKNHFDSREHSLLRRLQDLWALKTNDTTVQRKAVRELLTVLQNVFELHSRRRRVNLRQRRHASRAQASIGPSPSPAQR